MVKLEVQVKDPNQPVVRCVFEGDEFLRVTKRMYQAEVKKAWHDNVPFGHFDCQRSSIGYLNFIDSIIKVGLYGCKS